MTRYIRYEKSPGRPRLDGSPAGTTKETTVTVQLKLPASEKHRLAAYCAVLDISMSEAIRRLIAGLPDQDTSS